MRFLYFHVATYSYDASLNSSSLVRSIYASDSGIYLPIMRRAAHQKQPYPDWFKHLGSGGQDARLGH